MPVVVTILAIHSEETPAPAHGMENILITTAENSFDTKMDNAMKALEARWMQLGQVNKLRYGGYQTARAYAIQADHPPPHTPMKFPPLDAPPGPAYYQPGPNYQH